MASWTDFAAAAPDIAAEGRRLILARGDENPPRRMKRARLRVADRRNGGPGPSTTSPGAALPGGCAESAGR